MAATSHTFDAIVVGAGLNGSWAAKELAEGGMNVAILDAGPQLEEAFFAQTMGKQDLFDGRYQLFRLKSFIKGDTDKALNKLLDYRTSKLALDREQYPYTTEGGTFRWFRVRAVGGRGHLWGRVMLRLTDREFKAAEGDGVGTNWPIGYRDVEPFYGEVEQMMELGGGPSHCDAVPDGVYVRPRQLNDLENQFKAAVQSRWPQRNLVPNHVAEYEPSPLSPMLEAAQRTGNLTLFPNTTVKAVTLEESSGQAHGVEIIDAKTRKSSTLQAKFIVLAASPFETVRILLSSGSSKHPEGLGNQYGLLGTDILEHIVCSLMAELPEAYRDSNSTFVHNPLKLNAAPHGFYMPAFRHQESESLGFLRDYGIQGLISPDTGLFYLGLFGETLPRAQNRLSLNAKERDSLGLPTLKIEFSWSDNEIAMWKDQKQVAKEMLETFEQAMGLKLQQRITTMIHNHLWLETPPVPGSNHETGGAKMGESPEVGVVDPFCRLWDAPNVLVCDAACFPSIGHQNPTLTSMALAIRACRQILAECYP